MPNGGLVVTGSGASRTLTMTPAIGQSGSATITVTVTDANSGVTTTTFLLQVLPALGIGDAMIVEGNSGTTNLQFTVSLAGPAAGDVTVNYTTKQGTAIEGVDYTATSGILTIPNGETSGTISVPVIGDTTAEINETFVVQLSGVTGAVLGDSQGAGTILNDDGTPPVTAWARMAGASAAGSTLTKTGGNGWNAGGSTSRALASGDGSVEFSVPATDQGAALGLSRGDSNTELADIDFAIVPYLGEIYVLERGVAPPEASFGPYAAGDRFAIVVSGGVVSYQHNGVTFFTSSYAPQYPLLADAALYTPGATLADVVFAGPVGPTPRRLGDFDGDGQTDVVIYRPSSGQWFNLLSGPGYTEFTALAHGNPPDVPVTGDYDGDRVADIAVFRPGTSTWDILKSSTYFTTSLSLPWGTIGDVPVPADYDGDGLTDIAIWRPSSGEWWILNSSSNFTGADVRLWGAADDKPVQGDYDGDGAADPAVYRPSTAEWFVLKSSTGFADFTITPWGAEADITVPGDFDGDGKFDPTVYRPYNGTWFSLLSSQNYTTFLMTAWGAPADTPVMGDYDGDGKADLVVYRPFDGSWWVLRSAENYTSMMLFLWGYGDQYPALRRP
jgi:hypothetical protein